MAALQLPCRVCEDPSTGIHYGVFSCDACKGFFSRQLRNRRRKPCQYDENCDIKGTRKNTCAPCRFRICLAVGMSQQAIMRGRYTEKWKRSVQTKIDQMENNRSKQTEADHLAPSAGLQARLRPDTRLGPNGESLEEIINKIVEAYDSLPSNLRFSQEYLDEEAQRYWEHYKLKEKLFGKMTTVSTEEFEEILSITGLDIDDRMPLSESHLKAVRRWVCKLVRFSKTIPGFKELQMEDQFSLLKYNAFEFWFMGVYKGFSSDLKIAVHPNGICYHEDETAKVMPSDITEIMFDVARSLKRMTLTSEEQIITQTCVLFFSDRAPLKDKAAVEALQSTLVTCLEHLVSKRPSPRDRVRGLGQAFDMLTTVRRLSSYDDKKETKDGWMDNILDARRKYLAEEMELLGSV